MIDFRIQRGPSELILSDRLIVEEGCWYLCEDTAELFLGTKDEVTSELSLKQINGAHDNELIDPEILELLNTEINDIKESLSEYAKKTDIPVVDGFATKAFVQEELGKINIPDVRDFITEAEVEAKGYLTEQDISDKADKEHTHTIADITDYIAPDLSEYATEELVHQLIAEAELKDKEADLKAYYTKSEVDALIPDVTGFIKEIPSNYITESELAEELAKIEHPTVDLDGYATEQFVTDAITEIEIPDVSDFITEADLSGYALKSDIPDITGKAEAEHTHEEYADKVHTHGEYANVEHVHEEYANKVHTHTEYAEVEHTHDEYLTEHQSLDDYAKKTDIPVVPTNVSAFANDAGYLTEHIDISGKADKVHEHTEYANKTHNHSMSEITDYIAPEIPSLDGYATEKYVDDAIAAINPVVTEVKQTLEKEVLPKVEETILPTVNMVKTEIAPVVEELAEKAATREWVQSQGYLTQHQSLEEYAKKDELFSKSYNDLTDKPEIPSINGLATEDFVRTEIKNIDIPTVDTSNLVTTETLNNVLATKADKVLFTTAKFVTKPVGDFVENEDISGYALAELFAKLLGLSDEKPGTDEPDSPEIPKTPEEILEYLTKKNASIYVYDESDQLVQEPFTEPVTWTPSEASVRMDGVSTKYIIKDGDTIVEAGYQQATIYSDTYWLTVALPSEINNIKVKMYVPDVPGWIEPDNWHMIKAPEQTIPGYTIWTVPEEAMIDGGATYRFVISN